MGAPKPGVSPARPIQNALTNGDFAYCAKSRNPLIFPPSPHF